MAKRNILDRTIGFFSPRREAERVAYRRKAELLSGGSRRGYEAASVGRRTSGWITRQTTNDDELRRAGPKLRERSRDLDRNNGLYRQGATRHADYLVGSGFMAKSVTRNTDLDQKVNDLWKSFTENIDPEGQLTFDGFCYKAVRMMVVDGEAFARRRDRKKTDGLKVPLQVQLLEAEFLDGSKHGPTTGKNRAVNGVEFDAIGGRRAYWIFPQHPNSSAAIYGLKSSAVKAGEVAHLFEPVGSQTRGAPWFTPVMLDLKDMAEYTEAEILRKKIEACNVGVVTRSDQDEESEDPNIGLPNDDGTYEDRPPTADDEYRGLRDGYGDPVDRFEPGQWLYADEGDNIHFNNPSVSAGQEAFLRAHQRKISAGMRIPYELLTADLSQVTFASGKLGQLAYQRFVRTIQWNIIVPMFCRKIWGWFIDVCLLNELIPDGDYPVEWTMPRFESITPIDDVRADMLECRNGFASWDEKVKARGDDPDKIVLQISERNKQFDTLGLMLDCDPRRVSINGQAQMTAEKTDAPPKSGAP